MKIRERIIHVLIFQVSAGFFSLLIATFLTGRNPITASSALIAGALIAMTWNGIYNYFFDRIFGSDRMKRSLKIRIIHITIFEIVLILMITPVYALLLGLGLWEALLLNLTLALYFTIYAFIFNWAYDIISHQIHLKLKKI